ncbi:hypothetical protein, partial [Klebsiella aerogenes]|uniref:hypothetical protein n=1 Tax=Klebsiella aerogenes TaxID=548 RepID=UPI0019531393
PNFLAAATAGLTLAVLAGCGRNTEGGAPPGGAASAPAAAASAPPPQNVSVMPVRQADVPVTVEASGTVTALQS